MCGIIGYVGDRQAVPVLIGGLKKLEYRGYDSSGVGVIASTNGKAVVRKSAGKIKNLETLMAQKPLPESCIGISHTRWATHGAPNQVNAHPHQDCSHQLMVVHNGIIENYDVLREELRQKGHHFVSQTDTEVVVHLIESYYKGNLLAAVRQAIKRLRGAFALGVISVDDPHTLIAARIGSPLIIGLGKGENFIASDVPAIIDQTRKIIYLKDGELAIIKAATIEVMDFAGKKARPKVYKVDFAIDAVEKQGYAHFMLKEMHEQPDVLRHMWKQRIKGRQIELDGIGLSCLQLKAVKQIVILACGTAYHAGMVGKYIIESLAAVPVTVDVSSEFRYRNPLVDKKTLVIAISQSGETADTLAAVREAKAKGARVITICNVVGSSLVRESDGVLYTHAGPEIGVASTKAYTAQLGMLYLLALHLGVIKETLSPAASYKMIRALRQMPELFEKVLQSRKRVAAIAKKNSHFGCFLFLGRNVNYPSALEGALKLKEISYIPAEGYAAGEMKHGPIALIDEYRAVVCVVPQSDVYEKMISNMQEILARKGNIIAVATDGDTAIKAFAHDVLYVPKVMPLLTPLLVVLPLQLLAYYISVQLGCDVDQPRNLAKSVTVE